MSEETADEKIERVAKEEKAAEDKKAADEAAAAKGKSAIEKAEEILKNITEQNVIMADNIKKAEKLKAELMLEGKTPAGQGSTATHEEKEIEEAKKLIAGTGFEDRIFPTKK